MRCALAFLLFSLTAMSTTVFANFENSNNFILPQQQQDFVAVDEAFAFNAYQQNDQVLVDWQIKPGYYLYQSKLKVMGENVEIGSFDLREGKPYQDEFFGSVKIYTEPLFVTIPLRNYQPGAKVTIEYQGCAKAGFCYPPERRDVDISPFANASNDNFIPNVEAPTTEPVSSESSLAAKLSDNWWTPLLFLALGVGLAFTPCVLPMYPILTSIVLGSGKLSQTRALALAFIYVQGMALTYTLLGLVVASAGLQFQAAMQHPYVLVGLSVLFVALSLSMFGLYSLQLPSSAQTWLNNLSNKQTGGNTLGVFAMGAISGLVCSPCTTAPLSGALLYVAQSGDLLTGGIALYALAMGMGIPLILVAVFGNKLLPKAGGWMDRVKTLFGFVLLAAPIFLLERILPPVWSMALWSSLGLAFFAWVYHIKSALPWGGWKQSLVGIVAILGLLFSAQPILQQFMTPEAKEVQAESIFTPINDLDDLKQQLQQAKALGKPVMLDFYADWCAACKEFDKYTFHHADVQDKLGNFVLLQADVTKSTPQDIELLEHMKILGLPTIAFWDSSGQAIDAARITGFMKAAPFLEHLDTHQL